MLKTVPTTTVECGYHFNFFYWSYDLNGQVQCWWSIDFMYGSCLFPIYGCTNIYGFNLKDIPKIPVCLNFFILSKTFLVLMVLLLYSVYVLDPDPDLYRYLSIRIRIWLLFYTSLSTNSDPQNWNIEDRYSRDLNLGTVISEYGSNLDPCSQY